MRLHIHEIFYGNNDFFEKKLYHNYEKAWISMNKVLTDPLSNKQYIYSVSNNNNEYEILTLLEWDLTLNFFSKTNASTISVTPRIDWTYNRIFIKTPIHVIFTPSIINSEVNDVSFILDNTNIKSQVISGGLNLPNYWNINYTTWALTWMELQEAQILSKYSTDEEQLSVFQSIVNAYTWTVIATNWWTIQTILDKTTNEDKIEIIEILFLENITMTPILSLVNWSCWSDNWWSLIAEPTNLCIDWTESAITDNWIWYTYDWMCYWINWWVSANCSADHLDPEYVGCISSNFPEPFSATTTYGSCDTADIIVCSWNGVWYTIAACNVWTDTASTAYNDSNWYWELFQWWNNAWIKSAWTSPT